MRAGNGHRGLALVLDQPQGSWSVSTVSFEDVAAVILGAEERRRRRRQLLAGSEGAHGALAERAALSVHRLRGHAADARLLDAAGQLFDDPHGRRLEQFDDQLVGESGFVLGRLLRSLGRLREHFRRQIAHFQRHHAHGDQYETYYRQNRLVTRVVLSTLKNWNI